MTAHIHAALMAEYAKDAAETDKPWERWEWRRQPDKPWCPCKESPNWFSEHWYRRKRVPLCQVEGKDVFPGDKLWHVRERRWMTASHMENAVSLVTNEKYIASTAYLTWVEPPKTKTVYQWAYQMPKKPWWNITGSFYETELEAMTNSGSKSVIRLDYTALEVPV